MKTIYDLSPYLQVSRSLLFNLAQEGKVPDQKMGKRWRLHRRAFDHWLITAGKLRIEQGGSSLKHEEDR